MSGAGVTPFMEAARRGMRIRNEYARQAIAELLGTAIVTLFAVGGGVQHFTSSNSVGVPQNDSMQPIFGSLFGLMAAILIVGGSSGGHVNPAVTLGLCIAGNCSWIKLPLFWVAQFFGAYIGAGLALANYKWLTHGLPAREVLHASAIAPTPITPIGSGFLDQIIGTSILVMLIIACCDKRNMQVPKALIGFFICLTICGLAMCFGVNAGAVLNPARDFGARLMALSVGYHSDEIMTVEGNHWWLVGFFGPLIGGAVGSVLYVLLIGAHLQDENEDEEKTPRDNNAEDWRSTRFMSKNQAPQPPMQFNTGPQQQQQQQAPQQGQQYPQNQTYGANNYGYAGQQAGYVRDDMRNRQGY